MASKILKNAYATGGTVTGKQVVEPTTGERVVPITDIDAILQARLRLIEQKSMKNAEKREGDPNTYD
jgi:cysteine synthase